MKGKSFRQRLISSILSCAMVLTMATPAYAAEPAVPGAVQEETAAAAVTMNDVESIQAFTDETIYGTGVVEVEVTYKEGVNLAGITADSYILEDRGSLNPDFGQIAIEDAVAEGQTVTLEISAKSQATENNKMVYTGDNKEGSRERNAFGIYCTGSWYRDENGVIHYGKDDNDAYENNTTGLGYQARECLELKLRHAGEAEEAAACLADENGKYNEDGLWKETVDRQFGEGGFQSFADLGIQIESTAKDATDGTADEFVRGYAYIPEDYEPSNGIVFTLQGFGISFWTLNGANNEGTGIMYDSATTSWKDSGAIVVNIHDRSGMGKGGDNYDFVVDDVNVMKYFIDTYEVTGEVVLQGNSRGTNASSVIIKALAGRPYNPAEQSMDYDSPKDHQLDKEVYDFEIDTFICQNGTFGGKSWSDEDWEAIGETMMRVWVFDGEQDTNNIENIAKYKEVMSDLKGWWLRQNVRLTGYTSNLYYPWGESDHSTTRINGWYFDDAAYYGPDLTLDENGEIVYNTKLRDGDTYQLECRGSAATNSKNGYSYMVYDDLYQEWAFDDACPEVTDLMVEDIESIQATTDETIYGVGVVKVDITYKEGVDLRKVSAKDYVLEDRGTLNPDFGEVAISDITVNGQVVTLNIAWDTGATASNKFLYTGPNKEGSRQRNAFGVYCTGAWYRDVDGVIHYGKDDNDEYENNTTGQGYQARECLELRLYHDGEDEEAAACLADDLGHYNADGLWKETIDNNFGEGGFITFEEAGIEIPSTSAATEGTGDPLVKGYFYIPESYTGEEAVPMVVTIQGHGISYWKLPDGTNNFGCGIMYDSSSIAWMDDGAIVVNIADRSSIGNGGADYDYVMDDVSVMKYFLDNYNIDPERIVLHGNSRSTMAASTIIQALAGQPYTTNQDAPVWGSSPRDHQLDKTVFDFEIGTFVCNNGLLGGQGLWTDADRKAIAKTGLRAWCFDSEQDFNNIDFRAALAEEYKAIGYSDAWIEENLRISCYPSELFYYWGESDHSVTRMNYWYFDDELYYGPDLQVVDGEIVYNTKLNPGDKYTSLNRGQSRDGDKEGYEYTLYGDLFQDWALKSVDTEPDEKEQDLQQQVTSIQATTVPNFYGHKVSTVEITFAEDTDAAALAEATFTLYDRGSANPQFGEVKISDVKVEGNTVILTVDQGSDKVTDRSRNSFGTLNTTGWYSDVEGNIYYGTEQTTDALGKTIYPNTAKKTCQPRELDLILCINGTDITEGIMSTDGAGKKLADTVWQDTIKTGLDEIVTEMVDVGWKAEGYTMVNDEGKVPVQIIYPEGYDVNRAEAYPVVFYQCGGGVCYWELTDTSAEGVLAPANNLGCNTVYDNMMTEWHKQFPEAIILSVNVHSNTETGSNEIAAVLEYAAANWNADINKTVGVGNSMGTLIISELLRKRSDLVTAYVECNGNLGGMAAAETVDGTLANSSLGKWTVEEVQAMIDNNVAVWMFNGETDGDNPAAQQDVIEIVKGLHREAGKSEAWINGHLRASGLQSWKFKEWGETDHSVTKVVAWNYIARPYNDVTADGAILNVGDTYKYSGAEESYTKYPYTMDYDYTVYAESVAEWVKKLFAGEYEEAAPVEKQDQTISTRIASSVLTYYGAHPFNLKAETSGDGRLTYKSGNTDVVKVSKDGTVSIVGTGKATVTITAHSSESYNLAAKKIVIRVVPKKAALKSVKNVGKGKMEVTIKKDSMASGYMVQYSTDKTFKKYSTIVIGKTNQNVVTVKNLTAGKYYVRVCAYKTIGGNKYCGFYSDAVKIKVK